MTSRSMINPVSTDEIVKLSLDSVFSVQDKITAIPMAVADNIKSIWRNQINLLENTGNLEKSDKIYQKLIFRAAFDFMTLRARFEPFLAQSVAFWTPYYEKSKALADKRKKLLDEQKQERLKRKLTKKKGKEQKKSGKEFERVTSEERKKQLERARAWRKSMNLEV
jgi:poly(A) polymerase